MIVKQMADRLGLTQTELDVLLAEEQAHCLPEYRSLSDYLEAQINQRQSSEWRVLMNGLVIARKQVTAWEAIDEFHKKLKEFIVSI
jgi:hypothetical protein